MSARTKEIVTDAVRGSWEATFPDIPFDPARSWSDIGLDSLKALELIFRLEAALGTKVGFDTLTVESTAGDLIRSLSGETPAQDRHRIFLVPGLFGDEPKLSQFRNALHEFAFETMLLPGLDKPARIHASVRRTAALLADDLIRAQPDGPVTLAGYSFGALVAQEMTCQLEAKGRVIESLIILDGMLHPVLHQDGVVKPAPASDSIGEKLQLGRQAFLDRAIFAALYRLNLWEPARRFLLGAAPRHDWSWSHARTEWLFIKLRNWAVLTWKPDKCRAPTLLVTSDDFAKYSSLKTWRKICPDLTVVTVSTTHSRIFEPGPLAIIITALRQVRGKKVN